MGVSSLVAISQREAVRGKRPRRDRFPGPPDYCTSPPDSCEARSIQFCSACVGYFCVGPALTFAVGATEAVAMISVAMRVLNIMSLRGVLGRQVQSQPLASVTMRDANRIEGELPHSHQFFSANPSGTIYRIVNVTLLTVPRRTRC